MPTNPISTARQTSNATTFEFGSIVLARFPFTDLVGSKVRPALVVSRDNARRADVVVAFITSNSQAGDGLDSLALAPSVTNGLKVPSLVRFDKIATVEKRIVAGKLGDAETIFLTAAGAIFRGVFGFTTP